MDRLELSTLQAHMCVLDDVCTCRYAARADLAARLGPGFRVQMGFGLHVGWAIEGAIGEGMT
jgi:hypothetical protein